MISNDALGTCFHFKVKEMYLGERSEKSRCKKKAKNGEKKKRREKPREVKHTAENDVVFQNYYLKYGMLSANGSHSENLKLKIKYFKRHQSRRL